MNTIYFKPRGTFDFSPDRYEIGRPFSNNRRHTDNFFLLKLYSLDPTEYRKFYDFHLQHYLKANPDGEQVFYEHVWHIIDTRIKHYERQSPFSSSHETNVENIRKLQAFQKMLNGMDKWNARAYPELLAEKDRQLIQQKARIEELEKKLENLNGYEVQHEIEIKEGYLPTLIDLIRQLPELKLPNSDRLLKCYNRSPYYKMISKYFMHGDKPIPMETCRNYFVEGNGDVPSKGTPVPEESKLFRIVPVTER